MPPRDGGEWCSRGFLAAGGVRPPRTVVLSGQGLQRAGVRPGPVVLQGLLGEGSGQRWSKAGAPAVPVFRGYKYLPAPALPEQPLSLAPPLALTGPRFKNKPGAAPGRAVDSPAASQSRTWPSPPSPPGVNGEGRFWTGAGWFCGQAEPTSRLGDVEGNWCGRGAAFWGCFSPVLQPMPLSCSTRAPWELGDLSG